MQTDIDAFNQAAAMCAQITKNPKELPVRLSLQFWMIGPPIMVGNPIAGAILKHQNGEFWGLQLFSGLVIFASVLLYVVARIKLAGWKIMEKV